ncbi:LppA family lipoprotein [Flaviflexus massiliensis]|uniref:LppA family lipoprotein n=1 Tax=Flaviflexus massiliensis TaxID=1522309 RepID=UPI0006D540D1|nr:LppA family lipoprotein [Flaviflexus massiliensis]
MDKVELEKDVYRWEHSQMLDDNGLFFDGQKPFLDRVTIDVADQDLRDVMVRVRDRIDEVIGTQSWQNISSSSYEQGDFATCQSDGNAGRYTLRDEGLTFDVTDEDFPRVLEIVKELVKPVGYDSVVDSSNEKWFYVDIFNEADGGYVHLTMAKGKGLIMQVNTGCRPWSESDNTEHRSKRQADSDLNFPDLTSAGNQAEQA